MLNIAPIKSEPPQLSATTRNKLLYGGNGFNEGRTFIEHERARWRLAGPVSAICIAAVICWLAWTVVG